jgi:hypothetical protein
MFYIPFTKKTVDDLLEKTGTDRNNIKYYGNFARGPNVTTVSFRNGDYSYEQFVNTDWEYFQELSTRQGGPTSKVKWVPEDKKKYIG